MKLQHTPGPWVLFNAVDEYYTSIIPDREDRIFDICHFHFPVDKIEYAECEANARLIAAAPDMLEALISIQAGLLPYIDESGIMRVSLHCWRDLKSIIESATGLSIEEVLP